MRIKTKEQALEAVRSNGAMLRHVPKDILDEEICIEAAKNNMFAEWLVPKDFRTWNVALAQHHLFLSKVPKAQICLSRVPEAQRIIIQRRIIQRIIIRTHWHEIKFVPKNILKEFKVWIKKLGREKN